MICSKILEKRKMSSELTGYALNEEDSAQVAVE